jgi:hypothetical protein
MAAESDDCSRRPITVFIAGDLGVLAVNIFQLNQTMRHQLAPLEPAE